MKKGLIIFIAVVVLILLGVIFMNNFNITGKVAGSEFAGNSEEEQVCMQGCVEIGCESGNMECMTGNQAKCMNQCNVQKAIGLSGDEKCVQDCIDKVCVMGPEYLSCMESEKSNCDEECGMKGDAPDESEMGAEELCISRCVAKEDETVICGNSKEGEIGNALCQRCASECVHLYEGPCLNDEQLSEKEKACESCEHCYGEPVEGASGQGWDCIVDVECKDASSEFGDDAGTGDASFEEGHEEPGIVSTMFKGIGDFFKGLFGGNSESESSSNGDLEN
ncbi:hypothetical protein HOD75_03350 [archaeon]|jgi:hypothetical protein|nr:hypothetical protein [archaeon]MBT4241909.1 hypothetical protein [archaeon]MBT4418456.1 hypothetical protein [archaeon]